MISQSRIGLAVIVSMAGCALIVLSGSSQGQGADDLPKIVKSIAAEIKKGNEGNAKKMATKAAKKIEEISDLMHMYRPVTKGGLGLEAALKKANPNNAEELGNLTVAMAELTLAKGWDKNSGKKTKKAWNEITEQMKVAAKGLALAKDAASVTASVSKVNDSCNRCHSIFKE